MRYIATIIFDSQYKTKRTLNILDAILEDAGFEKRIEDGVVTALQLAKDVYRLQEETP